MCKKFIFALILWIYTVSSALAYDVGEIALVEDSDGKIMEVVMMPDQYLARVACKFYQDHPDIYQAIFVFSDIPLSSLTNVQQGWPVKSISRGIGRELPNGSLYDQTAKFCSSNGVLRQAVKMGDIAKLPDNPDDRYTGIFGYALTGIELMGHEFGHQWLVNIRAKTADGRWLCAMKAYEPAGEPKTGECEWNTSWDDYNQHWSYYFNSDASLMYGSRIRDLGNGQFEITYDHPKYSELDQYLMGLRLAEEVDSSKLFYVDNGNGNSGSASLPIQPGKTATISGTRVNFTINDVIRAMGERIPQKEPCHWKGAFIIVYQAGKPPSQKTISKVDTYRRRWETFYDQATDNRGSFDTTLDGRGTGTATCPGEPVLIDAGHYDVPMQDSYIDVSEDVVADSYPSDIMDVYQDSLAEDVEDANKIDVCCVSDDKGGYEDILDISLPDEVIDAGFEDTYIEADIVEEDTKRPKTDLNSLSGNEDSGCSCNLIE